MVSVKEKSLQRKEEIYKNNKKFCLGCNKTLSLTSYGKRKHTFDGLSIRCKKCYIIQKNSYVKDPILQKSKNIFSVIRGRAKRENIKFDLDVDFIYNRLKIWKCEITGLEFKITGQGHNIFSPSVDKINPDEGYTKDNVRFILWGINAFKCQDTNDINMLVIIEKIIDNKDKLILC